MFIGTFFSPSVQSCCQVFLRVRSCRWGIVWVFFSLWHSHKCRDTRVSSYSEKFATHIPFTILQGNLYGNFRYLNQNSALSAKVCYPRGQCKPPASHSCPFLLQTDTETQQWQIHFYIRLDYAAEANNSGMSI